MDYSPFSHSPPCRLRATVVQNIHHFYESLVTSAGCPASQHDALERLEGVSPPAVATHIPALPSQPNRAHNTNSSHDDDESLKLFDELIDPDSFSDASCTASRGTSEIAYRCNEPGLAIVFHDKSTSPSQMDATTTPSPSMSGSGSRKSPLSELPVQQPNESDRDSRILSMPSSESPEPVVDVASSLSLYEPIRAEGNRLVLPTASLTAPAALQCPHCGEYYGSDSPQAQRFR
ncbi:uncharacterized protein Z520_10431 [Fonsecaea multimorphosa CBS 102226]|uniref:Uncharacterized protein n=1 Tax=Fonsecaea multimorphosa CBS 102226 TaxID=1442371 RepID=A0A0D2I9F5_9EURO|nr:uncharacterized protein Z520_10431 [Fonsecaea multimorphosa CBS 102226]KIX93806.1 hypothetical protein Z520_10431 [Fonsecaea multimorphosa CBS 102226]OAL19235.1 hypothetical protein AYO22_09996 [Fonsecaea multimorphosa]